MRIRGSLQTGRTGAISSQKGGDSRTAQQPEAAGNRRAEPVSIALALLLLVVLFMFMAGDIVPVNRVAEEHHSEYGDLIEAALYTAVALSLAYLPPFRGTMRDHGWRRQLASCGWIVLLTAMLLLPFVGGVFNRIRGGWRPLGSPSWMEDHSLSRLATIGVPNGVVVGTLSGNALLGVHFGIFSFLGALPGWGCYYAMAFDDSFSHPDDCAATPNRYGMFDWLLGKAHPPTHSTPQNHNLTHHTQYRQAVALADPLDASDSGAGGFDAIPWPFWKRYLRDFAGMGLRGLAWLLPPGLGLQAAGYGPLVTFCGALMPVIYTLCWIPHGLTLCGASFPCFGGGPGLGELLWGITMWMLFVATLLPGKKNQSSPAVAPSGYAAIDDGMDSAPLKGAVGCALRMRTVLEVVAVVQLAFVTAATIWVAIMNYRADG